jgi:uncharacterized pyridoxal phosphate-containing UPF0001 family protein
VQAILLQVNIGREESKGGFEPAEVSEAVFTAAMLKGVRVKGLMTIPLSGQIKKTTCISMKCTSFLLTKSRKIR